MSVISVEEWLLARLARVASLFPREALEAAAAYVEGKKKK